MINNINPLLNETFVFRPNFQPFKEGETFIQPYEYTHADQTILRYAEGKWIPDDGELDLAFVKGVVAYGVTMPYYYNILWGWRDIELTRKFLPDYLKRSNAHSWHYQTINNTPILTNESKWKERENHPNYLAFESAMHKCSSIHGVANGSSIDLTNENTWIENKALLVKSTMQPVIPPENPVCYLCLDNGKGHIVDALNSYISDLEGEVEESWKLHQKAEIDMYDYKDQAEKAEQLLEAAKQELNNVVGVC